MENFYNLLAAGGIAALLWLAYQRHLWQAASVPAMQYMVFQAAVNGASSTVQIAISVVWLGVVGYSLTKDRLVRVPTTNHSEYRSDAAQQPQHRRVTEAEPASQVIIEPVTTHRRPEPYQPNIVEVVEEYGDEEIEMIPV